MLWKWFVMADTAGMNRAKNALAPLGLTTVAELRLGYPPIGKEVFLKVLVTLKTDPQRGPSNEVERFEPCPPPAGAVAATNPFGLPPDANEGVNP